MERFGAGHVRPIYLLLEPYRPSSKTGVDPAFERAAEAGARASDHYSAAAYAEAAREFLRALTLMRLRPGADYVDLAAENRAVYAHGAACSWLMFRSAEAVRDELLGLERAGVVSREELRRALDLIANV